MKLRWAALATAICTLPLASAILDNKDRGDHVPFQVALVKNAGLGSGDSRYVDNYKCSGVLYDLEYVWTTKTCLDKFTSETDILVVAGTKDLTASKVVPATNQRAGAKWWKHPNAQTHNWANYDNVGAVKLASPFASDTGKIEAASVVPDANTASGLKGTDVDVTGWGTVSKTDKKPTALLQELNTKYKLETLPASEFPKNGEMALALMKGVLDRGVCDFDEGSPVFGGGKLVGITAPGCAIPKAPVDKEFDVALGYVHYKQWLETVKADTAITSTPCTSKLSNANQCPVKGGFAHAHFPNLGPVCVQNDPATASSVSSCPRSTCSTLAVKPESETVAGSTGDVIITRTATCVQGSDPIHREAKLVSTDGNTVLGSCRVENNGAKYVCNKPAGTTSTNPVIAVVRETSNTKIAHAQTTQIKFTQAAPAYANGKSLDNYLTINGTDKAPFATPVKISWDNTALVQKPQFVEFFAVDPLQSDSFSDADALNAKDRWVRLTDKIDATAKNEEVLQIPIPYEQVKDMMHSTSGVTEDVKHYKIITRTTGNGLHSDFVRELKIDDRPGGGFATDRRQRHQIEDVLYSGNPVQAANMTTEMLDDGDSEIELREKIADALNEQAKSKMLFGLDESSGSKAARAAEGFKLLSNNAKKHDGLTEGMYNRLSTFISNMAANDAAKPSLSDVREMMGATQNLKSFKAKGHKLAVLAALAGRELKEYEMLRKMTLMLRGAAHRQFDKDGKKNEEFFACSDGSGANRGDCSKEPSHTFITVAVADKAGLDTERAGVNYKGASPAIPLINGLVDRATIEYFTSSGPNPFDKATVDKEKGVREWRASSLRPILYRHDNATTELNQDFAANGPQVTLPIISGTIGGSKVTADRDFCTTRSAVTGSSITNTWKGNPTLSGDSFTCPIVRVSNQFYSVGYQFKAGEEAILSTIETDESSDDDGSSSGGSLWFLWIALFILCLCCIIGLAFMMMKKKGKANPTANNHAAAAPQTSYGMAPNTTPTDAVPVGNPAPQTHMGDVYGQAANYGNQPPPFFDQDGNPINK